MKGKRIITCRYYFTAWEASEMLEAAGDETSALELAISEARERARIYHMPAQWTATLRPDGSILVKQYHY